MLAPSSCDSNRKKQARQSEFRPRKGEEPSRGRQHEHLKSVSRSTILSEQQRPTSAGNERRASNYQRTDSRLHATHDPSSGHSAPVGFRQRPGWQFACLSVCVQKQIPSDSYKLLHCQPGCRRFPRDTHLPTANRLLGFVTDLELWLDPVQTGTLSSGKYQIELV